MNRERAVLALNLVAAKAALMAKQVEDGQLWPGQYESGIQEIVEAVDEANRAGKS